MIVQLTGTLIEALPTHAVLDVQGVGYEVGISYNTASELPSVGTPGVTLLTRMVVREDAMELYGFTSREERTLFDRLVAISGVGPKLALSVLSTFKPAALADAVAGEPQSARLHFPPSVAGVFPAPERVGFRYSPEGFQISTHATFHKRFRPTPLDAVHRRNRTFGDDLPQRSRPYPLHAHLGLEKVVCGIQRSAARKPAL